MLWVLIRSASVIFSSYFSMKTCYGYSLEASRQALLMSIAAYVLSGDEWMDSLFKGAQP